jgi:hypothetical protein
MLATNSDVPYPHPPALPTSWAAAAAMHRKHCVAAANTVGPTRGSSRSASSGASAGTSCPRQALK